METIIKSTEVTEGREKVMEDLRKMFEDPIPAHRGAYFRERSVCALADIWYSEEKGVSFGISVFHLDERLPRNAFEGQRVTLNEVSEDERVIQEQRLNKRQQALFKLESLPETLYVRFPKEVESNRKLSEDK